MTIEELREEATSTVEWESTPMIDRPLFVWAYTKGAEPREKRIAEAKAIIEKLSKSLFLAKGIMRDLIDDTVDFKESKERAIYCYEQEEFDAYKEAERFLKEK